MSISANLNKFRFSAAVLTAAAASAAMMGSARNASADPSPLVITEVDAAGSSNATYKGDWFELTNTGDTAIDVAGYGVLDSHVGNGTTVPSTLSDVNITPGASAVFLDVSGGGVSTIANFESAWFGTNVPAGFLIGTYGTDTGIGLSTSGDQVNLLTPGSTAASYTEVYGVTWTTEAAGVTLDNSAGGLYTGVNATLSTASAVGVDGAFTSFDGTQVGSPGVIAAPVPEPASLSLLALGGIAVMARRRRAK